MKKILSFMLMISLVVSLFTGLPITVRAATSGTCGVNLTWKLDVDAGTLTISGDGDMYDGEQKYSGGKWVLSSLPWYSNRSYIKKVIISDGVTSIGNYAFYDCDNLTTIMVPNSVTLIGGSAFSNSSSLSYVDIPSSVTTIRSSAFAGCTSMTHISIPKTITEIPVGLASSCKNLQTISLHDNITNIGDNAFSRCESLENISLPDKLISIGDGVFYQCTSLTKINIPDNVTTIGSLTKSAASGVFGDCINLKEINLSSSLKYIGQCTFDNCSCLERIDLPDQLEVIGYAAFSGCVNLKKITIPDKVVEIQDQVFTGCESLAEINVSENNLIYSSLDGVLFNKNRTKLLRYPNGKNNSFYEIPYFVTDVGDYSFRDHIYLKKVSFSEGVVNIEERTFCNCTNLTDIFVSKSVLSFGKYAFQDSGLTDIYYAGTENEWKQINKNNSYSGGGAFSGLNGDLAIHYEYDGPIIEEPEEIKILEIQLNKTSLNISIGSSDSLIATVLPENVTNTDIVWSSSDEKVVTVLGSGSVATVCASNEGICVITASTKDGTVKAECVVSVYGLRLRGEYTDKNHRYAIYDNSMTWNQAKEMCESLGGHLVTITSDWEKMMIDMRLFGISNLNYKGYWIGAREPLKNQFEWINGELFEYTNMVSSTHGFSYYDIMAYSNLSDYVSNRSKWDYWDGYSDVGFICEWDDISEAKMPDEYEGTVEFHADTWSYGKAPYTYKDNYFSKPATEYNHDLAKASIRLAMSAFSYTADGGFSQQYKYVEEFLEDLEFDNIEHNEWYEKEPEDDSMAVAIGKKKLLFDDEEYTVLAVALRGGNYGKEWAGDFRVGTGTAHEGFAIARDIATEYLKNYCKKHGVSGNVKLWITGYSRAAATTNLLAAGLDYNNNYLGFYLPKENIYAYCFECPAGVRNTDNSSGKYDNIFSIVNQNDFVPMVVMKQWGWDRYGITKYLPDKITGQTSKTNSMLKYYKKYIKANDYPYTIDDFRVYTHINTVDKNATGVTQGAFLTEAFNGLSVSIMSQSEYVENWQEAFVKVAGECLPIMTAEPLKESFEKNLAKARLNNIAASKNDMTEILIYTEAIKNTCLQYGMNYEMIEPIVFFLIAELKLNGFFTFLNNGQSLAMSHYPELCLAWMDAVDVSDLTTKSIWEMFNKLQINCPVDVEVYDSSSNLIAAIYNDEVQTIENGLCTYIDENGQKIVLLPTNEAFDVRVTATDDGQMTYSIQETDADTGKKKITTYRNVAISKNDKFTGAVTNNNYSLSKNDVELSSTVIENPDVFKVSVSQEGNGNISGGGSFYIGEFAKVTATTFENEEFLGWYNGEQLISNEKDYRFEVTEDIELTAKFTENTCLVTLLDQDGNIVGVNRVVKGNNLTLAKEPEKDGYTYGGVYFDETLETELTQEDVFYEDTTLFVKWVKNIAITDAVYANDTVAVSATMVDNLIQKSGVVFIALYYENKLIGLKQVAPSETVDNTFENIEAKENSYTVRIMYWDSMTKLMPLNKCEVTAVQQ